MRSHFLVKCLTLIFCGVAIVLLPSAQAFAQGIGLAPTTNNVTVVAEPAFPLPNELVTLSLNAYTLDLSGSTITWFIDGVKNDMEPSERVLKIPAGELGSTKTIRADLALRTGTTISTSYTLRPTQTDIIIESDTLVPSFYRGRPLPSSGSTIRAVALFNDGTNSPASAYSYRWRQESTVLFGGPVRGKNVAEMKATYGREVLVRVEVITADGTVVGSKAVSAPLVEPVMQFYADNPLRGLRPIAIADEFPLIAEEVDIRAEPYFVSSDIFATEPLLEWQINNQSIQNPNADQQIITLQRTEGSGRFTLGFHIRNLNNLLQGVRDTFTIVF